MEDTVWRYRVIHSMFGLKYGTFIEIAPNNLYKREALIRRIEDTINLQIL